MEETRIAPNLTAKTPTSAPPRASEVEPDALETARTIVDVEGVDFHYHKSKALKNINLKIPEKQVTAFIGPSGCGKSTLLRCINRMNDLIDTCTIKGSIKIHGREIYVPRLDVIGLRKRIGMVFQKANPFPKSIYENVIYSLRIDGVKKRAILDETVERSLKSAGLWDEVKDRLYT